MAAIGAFRILLRVSAMISLIYPLSGLAVAPSNGEVGENPLRRSWCSETLFFRCAGRARQRRRLAVPPGVL
jgi:hypothetical protein